MGGFSLIRQSSGQKIEEKFVFCDIGQGDGFVYITSGGSQIVFDSGPGVKITNCLDRIMPFGDRKIEAMLLTHPQQDHMQGQINVFENFQVERVFYTGVMASSQVFNEWLRLANAEKAQIVNLKRGDEVTAGAATFEVLWPPEEDEKVWKEEPPDDLNESSYVVRLDEGKFCAYLTGDVPKEIMALLVTKPCQLLKVGHHGSKTATDSFVVGKVLPKIAVIQVGANNRFGHPNGEALTALSQVGAKILRNDINGDIEVLFNAENGEIRYKTQKN